MIRLADYVFRHLAHRGVRHVFMVSSGGAMFLNDAVGCERRIQYICNHPEQACAMAAEAYARVSGGLAVVSVTAAPASARPAAMAAPMPREAPVTIAVLPSRRKSIFVTVLLACPIPCAWAPARDRLE